MQRPPQNGTRLAFWVFYVSLVVSLSPVFTATAQASRIQSRDLLRCAFDSGARAVMGYRIFDGQLLEVCPELPSSADPELEDRLIVPPGRYLVDVGENVVSVDAKKSGLYQLYTPDGASKQFIVWTKRVGIEKLMGLIYGLYAHGTRDDDLTTNQLMKKASTQTLSLTCGSVVRLTGKLLEGLGISSREIFSLTHEASNGIDDGHIMLEVHGGLGWELYDPDLAVRFTMNNQPLDAMSVAALDQVGLKTSITQYALWMGRRIDYGSLVDTKGQNFTFYETRTSFNLQTLERWYTRVLGSLGTFRDGTPIFWQPNPTSRQKITYIYPTAKFVSRSTFRAG